jgi:two-component system response regulator PilR (NtrC family)
MFPTELTGQSEAIRPVRQRLAQVAGSDVPLVITGEAGTEKEAVAAAVHANSVRAVAPFVRFNCAAWPEGLIEAELFGSVSPRNTRKTSPGRLQKADCGTLFVDNVDALCTSLRIRLLECIESRSVIGPATRLAIDVRVILGAATADVQPAGICGELLSRLGGVHLHLPPLRERRDDLPQLIRALWDRCRQAHGARRIGTLRHEVVELLAAHSWPGNVEELLRMLEALSEGAWCADRFPLPVSADPALWSREALLFTCWAFIQRDLA